MDVPFFAGAALYINLAGYPRKWPAIEECGYGFGDQLQTATMMQAPLAILSFSAGVSAWLLNGGIMWIIGAVLIGLVVPFTFIVIMPTNHQLLIPGRDLASGETRALLEKWGKLHAVRTLSGLLASGTYIIELFKACVAHELERSIVV